MCNKPKTFPQKYLLTNLLAICMQVAFICTGNINKLYSKNDNQGKKHKTDFTQFTNSTPHVNITGSKILVAWFFYNSYTNAHS